MKKIRKSISIRRKFLILLVLTIPVAFAIMNWKTSLETTKDIPRKTANYAINLIVNVIDSSKILKSIRYNYLIENQELPTVPSTSTIEIDKETGWYLYTDTVGKFSFKYPINWEIHTWDGRDKNDWNRKIDNGMGWEWYLNNKMKRTYYSIILVDSNKSEKFIGNPFISLHIVANQELLDEDINMVTPDKDTRISELFVLDTDETGLQCPSIIGGTFACYPNEDLYLKVNSRIFILRLTGKTNQAMNKVLDSFSFFE
jgi:hypothetical protein